MAKRLPSQVQSRKESGKKLSDKESRKYLDHLNLIQQFMGITDRRGKLQFASEAPLKGLGYSDVEIMKRPFWKASWFAQSLESQSIVKHGILEALGGETVRCEVEAFAKDGTSLPVTFSFSPLKGGEGGGVSIVAESGPVAVPKGKRRPEERLLSIFDLIGEAYFEADNRSRLVVASPSGAKLLGYETVDELEGKEVSQLWANLEERDKFLMQLSDTGKVWGYEASILKKDGTSVLVEVDAHLLNDASGKVIGSEGILRDLSERVVARESARKADEFESRQLSLMDGARGGILLVQDGVIKYANGLMGELVGHEKDELKGMRFEWILSPSVARDILHSCEQRIAGEVLQDIQEAELLKKDGTVIKVEMNMAVVDHEGTPAVLSIVHDMSEKTMLDFEIARYGEVYALIAQNVSEGVILVDKQLNPIYMNWRLYELLGYSRDEAEYIVEHEGSRRQFLLSDLFGVLPPGVVEALLERIERRNLGKDFGLLTEVHLLRRDGVMLVGELSTSAVEYRGMPATLILIRDITENKAAQDRLKESEHRLSSMFEAVQDIYFRIEPMDWRIVEFNPAGVRMLGYESHDDVTGKELMEIFEKPEDLVSMADDMMQDAKAGNPLQKMETTIKTKTGESLVVEIAPHLSFDKKGTLVGVEGIMRDITERKRAEAELARSEETLKDLVQKLKLSQEELSTPVIRIWNRILALPLIGVIDTHRAQLIMDILLTAVVETQSKFIIVDVTGVASMDTEVTNHLIRTIQSTRLLGAECIITGIKPEIAQTMVHLGVDLSRLVIRSDMHDGLEYGLKKMGLEFKTAN